MASGTVKWFKGSSGFGVITADAGGCEFFVHQGSLVAAGTTLNAGDRVEFEVQEGGKGSQAVGVRARLPPRAPVPGASALEVWEWEGGGLPLGRGGEHGREQIR